MKNFDTLLDEQMEDPEFRKEYVRLLEEGRRTAEAERDALAARLAAVEALFAGGPDTPCRTLWRATEGLIGEWAEIECVEVPLDELRAALATDRIE